MAESQNTDTVIGPDTVIKGEMEVENRARILGRFEGSIKAKGQVEVADKAICQANINASTIQIDGGMDGNVTASERVQLNATAKLTGDIVSAKLVVAEGASINGHVRVGPDAKSGGGGGGGKAAEVVVKGNAQERQTATKK
ncbi:MAG: polymer-forming cytoskeletal protein [Phycisphaerales bacterium]